MLESERNRVRQIFLEYEGTIVETEDEIRIEAENLFVYSTNLYKESEDKVIWSERHKKKAKAVIYVRGNPARLFGHEETYSIIGGFGNYYANDSDIRVMLERFSFKRKEHEQLSLFDDL